MTIKLKDGREIELTDEVLEKVADSILESGDLEEYPCVMRSDISGRVGVFTSEGMCTIISGGCDSDSGFGFNTDAMDMKYFKPFTGAIHYENGKPVKTVLNKDIKDEAEIGDFVIAWDNDGEKTFGILEKKDGTPHPFLIEEAGWYQNAIKCDNTLSKQYNINK